MENLFESLNHPDSAFFLLSALVSFLIGFISAWAMWSGQARRYQREAADWKKKFDDLTLEMTALREKLDLSTADLAKAKREAELALEQAAAVQNEKRKWQKDLDQSLEETVRLQASNHTCQATIEDLNNQIIGLKTRNEQLAQEAKGDGSVNEKLEEVQGSYGATLERLGSLEANINHLIAENDALRAEAKKEDENLLNLLKSYNDSTNRLGGLEVKLGSLMAENEVLRAELLELKSASAEEVLVRSVEPPIVAAINPADKEAITSGAISPSDAKDEVLAAIGTTIPSANADQKNDLTEIKGIGSFLEKKLNMLGIYTFDQISRFDANLIEKVTTAIEFFPGRIERDDWVGQAKRLSKPKARKAPAAASAKADDLKVVEGIGPKIEKLLNGAGILTWKELASTTPERLKEVLLLSGGEHYRIHDPSTWPDQARLAAHGEFDKLKEYKDFLSGGREPDKV